MQLKTTMMALLFAVSVAVAGMALAGPTEASSMADGAGVTAQVGLDKRAWPTPTATPNPKHPLVTATPARKEPTPIPTVCYAHRPCGIGN